MPLKGPAKVRRHYDEVAEIYDRRYAEGTGRSYHRHISDQVMNWLPPGGRLLDIGCGTGLFIEQYLERGGRGVGLDISPKM
ncbi:MAG TPA: methyltransferase domain-containing protein, partial [Methanoregulaceae archaeon]|nr:methyltransferase domain-containing protein [Methanoregulaceae archaeon]